MKIGIGNDHSALELKAADKLMYMEKEMYHNNRE